MQGVHVNGLSLCNTLRHKRNHAPFKETETHIDLDSVLTSLCSSPRCSGRWNCFSNHITTLTPRVGSSINQLLANRWNSIRKTSLTLPLRTEWPANNSSSHDAISTQEKYHFHHQDRMIQTHGENIRVVLTRYMSLTPAVKPTLELVMACTV